MRSAAGSCTKIARGLYRLRVSQGRDPVTRKRIGADRRFRGTEREATLELARMLAGVGKAGPMIKSPVATLLTTEYFPSMRSRLKKHSAESAISRITRHAIPTFGGLRLDQITPRTIDRWTEDLERAKVGGVTRFHVYQEFRAALRQFVRWGYVDADPTVGTHVPPLPASTQTVLDIDGANAYLDAFMDHRDAELECAVALAIGGGLRKCETCGLDWEQVDFDEALAFPSRGRHQ